MSTLPALLSDTHTVQFYVPGTYILTKKRILRYNVPDAMEVAQITLVGKFGKSRMSLFAEVLLTWLVFLSALVGRAPTLSGMSTNAEVHRAARSMSA